MASINPTESVGDPATKEVGAAVTATADAGAEIAGSAKDHAKTFVSEIDAAARKNPLGRVVAALLTGVVIGMITRGRN
jgi:hypothetical protein